VKDIIGPVKVSSREQAAHDIETQAKGDVKMGNEEVESVS
jgi:hypothetical protein